MTTETKPVTAHELYWQFQETCTRRELIRGVIHDHPLVGWWQSAVTMNAIRSLGEFVHAANLGQFVGPRTGFWSSGPRIPSLRPRSPWLSRDDTRFPGGTRTTSTSPGLQTWPAKSSRISIPPDEVQARVTRRLDAGTHMILLVHIDDRTVTLYRPGTPPAVLTVERTLDGADVVPGWTMTVRDLFDC